jgi:hypothetical protein
MITIVCLQLLIIVILVRVSRHRLEDALPALCFFLVLMPLEARLVVPGVFDLTTMRICLLTLLVLYVSRWNTSPSAPVPLKSLIILHAGCVLCSTFYSISVATSVKQLLSQVLEYYLLYYILVKTISEVRTLYKIMFAMTMAMGICCLFALLEAYASWSILRVFPSNLWITYNGGLDPLYIEWGRGLRVRSTFPHPILFGDALAMTIPISLYLLSIWENAWQRKLLWLVTILMFWSIYKTSSRGPWIATIIASVLLFILVRNRVRKYIAVLAIASLIVLACLPGIRQTISGLYESSTDSTSPVGSSYLYRDVLSSTVSRAVSAEPGRALLGYGLGTFREKGLEITFLNVTQRWYTCDDNWALFLYETGYVGTVLISLLLFAPLYFAIRTYWRLPCPDNGLDGVLFVSLSGFYFLLLSVAGYSWGQQGYMGWILISLIVSHSRVGMREESLLEPRSFECSIIEEEYDFHLA